MTGKNRFHICLGALGALVATPAVAQDSSAAPDQVVEAAAPATEELTEQRLAPPPRAPEYDPQSLAWHSAQQSFLSSLQSQDGWQYLPGGLRWRRAAGDGSGPHPTLDDTVAAHYAGGFVDRTTFDSSYSRGQPAVFPLNDLIKAWQMVLPLMGIGDRVDLAAPADLAYGVQGKGPIPGGATLLFTIELLGIQPKGAPPTETPNS